MLTRSGDERQALNIYIDIFVKYLDKCIKRIQEQKLPFGE